MLNFIAKHLFRMAMCLCGMSVLLMLFAAGFAVYRWHYLGSAVTTKATITKLVENKRENGGATYRPVYVFTDQRGQSVKVISSQGTFPPPGNVGDQIEVYYDPENSQNSIRKSFMGVWGPPVVFGCLGAFLFIVSGTAAFFTGQYLKNKEADLTNKKIAMFDFNAKRWNLWAKILCGMSVPAILIGAGFAVYRWNYLESAISTKATITNLIESRSDDGGTIYAPVYVFADRRGESVKVISSTASFPPPGEIGDKIEVLYDPENPQHSIQNSFFNVWGLSAIFGGLGAFEFIVFGAVAFFTGRHLKKQGEQLAHLNSPPPLHST